MQVWRRDELLSRGAFISPQTGRNLPRRKFVLLKLSDSCPISFDKAHRLQYKMNCIVQHRLQTPGRAQGSQLYSFRAGCKEKSVCLGGTTSVTWDGLLEHAHLWNFNPSGYNPFFCFEDLLHWDEPIVVTEISNEEYLRPWCLCICHQLLHCIHQVLLFLLVPTRRQYVWICSYQWDLSLGSLLCRHIS